MPHVRFTPRTLSTLTGPPPGKRAINWWDSSPGTIPGLCVRVTSSGAKTFYFVRTAPADKRKLWVRLGEVAALSLDAARDAAAAAAGMLARRQDPTAEARAAREARKAAVRERQATRTRVTVAQLVKRYIDARCRDIATATEGDYRRTLRAEIASQALGDRPADRVLRAEVRELLDRIERRAPAVRDRVLALLRASYRWGQDEERAPGVPIVERDPTRGLVYVVAGKKRHGRLDDDDMARWWERVEQLGPQKAAYLRLVLLTAPRRGEAHAGLWAHVDWEARTWTFPPEKRKLRKAAKATTPDWVVPLAPLAVEVLRELHAITGTGSRMFTFGAVGSLPREMQKATELKVTIHDLRRTPAMGLEELEVPPHVLSMVLGRAVATGHQQSDVHYVLARRPVEYRRAMERWAARVAVAIGRPQLAGVVSIGA